MISLFSSFCAFPLYYEIQNVKCRKNNNRFPNSKREEWENIFPSFTTKEEIGLVDGLVKYNPKQRLSAAEVSSIEKNRLKHELLLILCRHFVSPTSPSLEGFNLNHSKYEAVELSYESCL